MNKEIPKRCKLGFHKWEEKENKRLFSIDKIKYCELCDHEEIIKQHECVVCGNLYPCPDSSECVRPYVWGYCSKECKEKNKELERKREIRRERRERFSGNEDQLQLLKDILKSTVPAMGD